MTTPKEEEEIIAFFEKNNSAKKRLVIYSCVSGYPVSPEDLSLLDINRLQKLYSNRVKTVGFSGHHNGISADIAFDEIKKSNIINGILKSKLLNSNLKFNFNFDDKNLKIYNSYFRNKDLSFKKS